MLLARQTNYPGTREWSPSWGTIATRELVSDIPKGLMIYLKVHGSELLYIGVVWYDTTKRGTNMGYKGFQQSDSTCISYVHSSPSIVLLIEQ